MNNLKGRRFDWLTVLGRSLRKGRAAYWRCVCVCGKEKDVRSDALTGHHTKSCGCMMLRTAVRNRRKYHLARQARRRQERLNQKGGP